MADYLDDIDTTQRYWNERGGKTRNYVYGKIWDYGKMESGRDRHPYSPGHADAKTARVIAALEEVFHLLEQNYDFEATIGHIDPYKYPWQVKPHWQYPHRRDILVNGIDAEFLHEMTSQGPNKDFPYRRPAWIWQETDISQEPGFYRLDYWGRLALALKLDAALVPQPEDNTPVLTLEEAGTQEAWD